MMQKSLSPRPREAARKSGTLNLFLMDDPGASLPAAPIPAMIDAGPAVPPRSARQEPPYARFRLCRGFIDDLNRILPIRLRIQLEGELAEGRARGQVDGPSLRFRWEFTES